MAEMRILYEKQSRYQTIKVVEGDVNGRRARVLLLDTITSGGMHLDDGSNVCTYCEIMKFGYLLRKPDELHDVLMIGLGPGTIAKDLLARFPEAKIDVADIDEEVVKAAKRFFGVKESSRLKIVVEDGYEFIAKSKKRYDLVVLDAYLHGFVIPSHLCGEEMVLEVKGHLAEEGGVVLNMICSLEGEESELYKRLTEFYKKHFANVYIFPQDENSESVQNIILVADDCERKTRDGFGRACAERLKNFAGRMIEL